MKRWLPILAMAPVMYGLFRLVCWADRLYTWQYMPRVDPPTSADYLRAGIVFWSALLTPVAAGIVMGVVAFRRNFIARWPIAEVSLASVPLLAFAVSLCAFPKTFPDHSWLGMAITVVLFWAHLVIGGVVVLALLNIGACIRHHKWGKMALSALVPLGGMLYLLWLYAFIIYMDT